MVSEVEILVNMQCKQVIQSLQKFISEYWRSLANSTEPSSRNPVNPLTKLHNSFLHLITAAKSGNAYTNLIPETILIYSALSSTLFLL